MMQNVLHYNHCGENVSLPYLLIIASGQHYKIVKNNIYKHITSTLRHIHLRSTQNNNIYISVMREMAALNTHDIT